MTPIERLFGRDDKFYRLLETSAAEAQNGAAALTRLITQLHDNPEVLLSEIDQSRRKHKRIGREITDAIFKTFATPLEREDIEALSDALYKISKSIEKIAERLVIRPPGLNADPLKRQVSLLEQSTSIVAKMVSELRARDHTESTVDNFERLQAVEGDADRVMNELLKDLYQGTADARTVVFWKDLYELLEKAIDRCRNAGGLLFEIVLKNS